MTLWELKKVVYDKEIEQISKSLSMKFPRDVLNINNSDKIKHYIVDDLLYYVYIEEAKTTRIDVYRRMK